MAIAIVGDRNDAYVTHRATDEAFARLGARIQWVPTPDVLVDPAALEAFAGLVISSGSPYASMAGALAAITYAGPTPRPAAGDVRRLQHVVVEYARNVLGSRISAEHAETSPDAAECVISPLVCSLEGEEHEVQIVPDSLAGRLYGRTETIEPYFCNYGLNESYREALEVAGLRFSGHDEVGERIVELSQKEHPFFLATLYVPQASTRQLRHPLLAWLFVPRPFRSVDPSGRPAAAACAGCSLPCAGGSG